MSIGLIIENKLREAFTPLHLEVEDESYMHSTGANAESHFKVTLVTPKFSGERLINRHRAVNKILADELMNHIHALALVYLHARRMGAVRRIKTLTKLPWWLKNSDKLRKITHV